MGRLPAFFGVLLVTLAWETFRPSRPWNDARPRRLGFHAAVAAGNTLVMRLLLVPPLMAWVAFIHRKGWGLGGALGLTGWPEVLATLVVLDMLDYWWHRLNHRVFFFWRFHRAHHSDTHVDASTSLRFHLGELVLSTLAKTLWVLAWGPSVFAFTVFEAAITAFAQFHHANVDLPEPGERLVRLFHMTPRLHAAHHTVTLRTRDANFSTIFLWWDRLFGTFREADAGELAALGLPELRAGDLSWAAFLAAPARLGP